MESELGIPPNEIQSYDKLRLKLGALLGLTVGILAIGVQLIFRLSGRLQRLAVIAVAAITGVFVLFTGVLIYRDASDVGEKTDWKAVPSHWGVFSVSVPLIGPVGYLIKRERAVTNARKRHFQEICEQFQQELVDLEKRVAPYFGLESYLSYHVHRDLEKTQEQLLDKFRRFQQIVASTRGISEDSPQLRDFDDRIKKIQQLLSDRQAYNNQFVQHELDRCQEFFSDIGESGYSLNQRQREAVIRNDTYNRVIAGAGTGKTLVLTTRVAYLIRYQNIAPEDILVATFTDKAATEMKQRLKRDFDITGVEVTTLHAFGYDVIRQTRQHRPDVFDENDREHFIRDVIDQEAKSMPERFYDHFTEFLLHSDLPSIERADFETKEEFVEALRAKSYETLRGEEVKSRAEKLIADFLHIHQVDYRYEHRAEPINSRLRKEPEDQSRADFDEHHAADTENKGAYRPDFYLPSADVYIEHFGIDETGEVADYFTTSTKEYVEKIRWARDQFADSDAVLVETYQFEFDTGRLRNALEHRLTHHDVVLDKLSYEELVNETYEIHERDIPVWEQLGRFIGLARTFQISAGEIPDRLSTQRPAQYHFGMCGGLLLYAYEQKLADTRSIDYPDMIHKATQAYEEETALVPHYEHVLVDEFQDISLNQLQLVKELSGPDDAHLFAVGDDWQSIYSFQGAVVDLFIDFEDHFAPCADSALRINYRSPSQLVKAGASLIRKNDNQLSKNVAAASAVEAAVVKHRLGGYRDRDHVEFTAKLTVYLIKSYLENGCDPGDIMVLCRYDDAVDYLDAVRRRLRKNAIPFTGHERTPGQEMYDSAVIVESVHQVKGREADHVIVTHVSEDGMGFPATDRNMKLLEPVREVEMNTMSEERRLFYVAISRSIRTLDIITKAGSESRFVDEIDEFVDQAIDADDLVNVESESDIDRVSAKVAHLWDDLHPKKHQDGILEDHTDSIRFVSWASSEPPTLEEDTWYQFRNIRVNEYKGAPQVVVSGATEIEEIESEDSLVNIEDLHAHLTDSNDPGQVEQVD